MKLRMLVADDDALSAGRMLRLLAPYGDQVEVIGVAENGIEALEMIDRLAPEVVFLDVEMPLMDGIEVCRRMQHRARVVVFTASDAYRKEAREAGAFAYMCKPVGADEISELMGRIRVPRLVN
ncbi:MAG TPA: response regulator [Thermoanaerobaculia bacterium]|jgi:two-component system LytT family response regulator